MPLRHTLIDTKIASCGPVVVSPVSRVELVLRRDGRDVRSTCAHDLAFALDCFGYTLMWHEGFDHSPPARQWLEDRDSSLLTTNLVLLVSDRDGGLHWIAIRGEAWLCDTAVTQGRWVWVADAAFSTAGGCCRF